MFWYSFYSHTFSFFNTALIRLFIEVAIAAKHIRLIPFLILSPYHLLLSKGLLAGVTPPLV